MYIVFCPMNTILLTIEYSLQLNNLGLSLQFIKSAPKESR